MRRLFTVRFRTYRLISVWLVILSGCAQVPFTHYYTFDPDNVGQADIGESPAASPPAPVVLAIGTFEADVPYQQDRIAFRRSAYEVGFYEYHKWLRPLTDLVQAEMIRQSKASSLFSRVHGQAFQVAADYILLGTITMFDRWDGATSSETRIQITYQLLDASGEQIIWMDSIASAAPVSSLGAPVTTVQSFETALHINIQHALETVHDVVSRTP